MTAWEEIAAVGKPRVDKLEADLAVALQSVAGMSSDLATANAQVTALDVQVSMLNQDKAGLLARIKDLEAQLPAPTPDPTPTPTPTPTPVAKTLFGTGGGNTDRTKEKMGIDRRYYNSTQTASCLTATKANAAAGIITWSTFKVPGDDWAGAAAGKYDAWFNDLMAKLKALNTEVWVDVHHEPEGDGDLTMWTKMQDHYSRLVPAGSKIKYWLCVTGYQEEYSDTAWWDKYYPKGAPIYGIAYDNPYLKYGVPLSGGALVTTWSEGKTSYIDKLVARAKKYGVKAAIGEMGYSNEAFAKDKGWLERAFQACVDGKLEGVCYFDSILNSSRSWALGAKGTAKRDYFDATVKKFA